MAGIQFYSNTKVCEHGQKPPNQVSSAASMLSISDKRFLTKEVFKVVENLKIYLGLSAQANISSKTPKE